jgi:hypothetical protein
MTLVERIGLRENTVQKNIGKERKNADKERIECQEIPRLATTDKSSREMLVWEMRLRGGDNDMSRM